jgi:Mg2+/citrate symporter
MLAALGLLTIVALSAAIISRKMSPLVALIVIPIVAALVGGFGLKTGVFIVKGIQNIARQKFTAPFLLGASVVMTLACVLFGVFPL